MIKKVLFVAESAHDNPGSGGRTRIIAQAKLLQENGVKVHIVTFCQAFKLLSPTNLIKSKKVLENDSKSKVTYIPKIPTFKIKFLIILSIYWKKISLFIFCLFNKFKVHHCHGFGASLVSNSKLFKLLDIKVLTDVHGVSTEERYYSENLSKENKDYLNSIRKEVNLIQKSDFVFFVSNVMLEYYKERGYSKDNFYVIPCLSETKMYLKSIELNELRKKITTKNRIIFVYAGSYRKYQKAKETISIFKEIKEKYSEAFLLILTGHIKEFQSRIDKLNISKLDYKIMTLPQSKVHDYLCVCDFGFLLRDNLPINNVASPTKFAEYSLAGVPTIISKDVGDYSRIVKEKKFGIIIEDFRFSDNLDEFISYYLQNKMKIKQNLIEYTLEELTWKGMQGRYLRLYHKLIS
ncbi:MAG: glycosyltransferase [Flavobacteriales bacterium]|nr:glycosyltransferase [Flavobacteriales bacterium]